jgi:CheY-like chemotaxis protein
VLNLCQDRVEQSKKDRARKEDDGDTSTEHRPSEAEPDTDRDQYGNAEDGQTVEDMDGPPSVSDNQSVPKKVSRLSSNDDSGREGGNSERQENTENEHRSNDEPAEAGADAQTPEAQVPKPPFTKPLVLSRSPADAAPEHQNKPKERNLHGLCVDDNKINLRLLVTLMRREKHTYEQSENGQEALEAFKACNGPESCQDKDDSRQAFDFILMDIGMPVMNGIQCTKAIREHERKHDLRPTYIVACTAWGDGQTQREAKEAGMDAFLPKPLKFAHLKELLVGLMERE